MTVRFPQTPLLSPVSPTARVASPTVTPPVAVMAVLLALPAVTLPPLMFSAPDATMALGFELPVPAASTVPPEILMSPTAKSPQYPLAVTSTVPEMAIFSSAVIPFAPAPAAMAVSLPPVMVKLP